MSSQTGSPDGASALCGSVSPNASATTCDVAAVPRNWQPPPGVPHARQPMSAASSTRDQAVRVARADRLHLARVLAADRRQRHAAGHDDAGIVARAGQRQHHRGQPLVAGRDAHARPTRRGSERISRRIDDRGVVAVRQAVEHARRALRAAVARIADVRRERDRRPRRAAPRAASRTSRPISQWPVWIAERDRRAVLGAQPALRADDQELRAPDLGGVPAHPRVLRHAEQVAARLLEQHLGGDRQPPLGPLRLRARRREQLAGAEDLAERRGRRRGRRHSGTSPCDQLPSTSRHIFPVGFLFASSARQAVRADGVVAAQRREAQQRRRDADGREAGVAGRGERAAVVHRRRHRDAGRHLVVEQPPDLAAQHGRQARVVVVVLAGRVAVDAAGQVAVQAWPRPSAICATSSATTTVLTVPNASVCSSCGLLQELLRRHLEQRRLERGAIAVDGAAAGEHARAARRPAPSAPPRSRSRPTGRAACPAVPASNSPASSATNAAALVALRHHRQARARAELPRAHRARVEQLLGDRGPALVERARQHEHRVGARHLEVDRLARAVGRRLQLEARRSCCP